MYTVKIGEKYRHFKGNIIEVIMLAKNSETLENMVIYKHNDNVWVRPESMFLDKEEVSSRSDNVTKQKYRFELIEEEK